MRKNRNAGIRRLASFAIALVIATSGLPSFGSGVCAEETGSDDYGETVAYLVNEDGTQTQISDNELEEMREGSFAEIPDEIDVILDGSDAEWPEDMNGVFDDEDWEFSTDEDLFDDAVEEAEETAWDETGENAEALEDSPDLEGIISEEDTDGDPAEAETDPILTEADGAAWGTGNVEHIHIPELLNREITLISDTNQDAGEGWLSVDGKRLLAGSGTSLGGTVASGYYNVNITQSGNTVTVSGSIQAPFQFYGLFVDLTLVAPVTGYSVNQRIDMSQFSTGYHTVCLGIIKGSDTTIVDLIGRKYMSSNTITSRPAYNGVFEVYSSYFNYYPYNMALQNQAGDLYMEYSSNGGKTWSRTGYMRANMIELYISQAYKISGLKAKKKYLTRIRYGTFATYSTQYDGDGKSYFFGGPVLNTTTIKTGASKKPKIRSVTAKAVKIKYHQVRHYGKYTGVYLYTERFYTCKIKVTVRLKKKPGTKGLFINGKWAKGNKKTYTKTFTPYPNYYSKHPRGHYKFKVTVCSGQNKSWGGYSPSWSKNKKLS